MEADSWLETTRGQCSTEIIYRLGLRINLAVKYEKSLLLLLAISSVILDRVCLHYMLCTRQAIIDFEVYFGPSIKSGLLHAYRLQCTIVRTYNYAYNYACAPESTPVIHSTTRGNVKFIGRPGAIPMHICKAPTCPASLRETV